jgi:hypothetical protein
MKGPCIILAVAACVLVADKSGFGQEFATGRELPTVIDPDPSSLLNSRLLSDGPPEERAALLEQTQQGLLRLNQVADYSCLLHKRERMRGKLGKTQSMFVKVRHEPFSVYIRFLAPPHMKGQEAIYVEGQNDGRMLAHATGLKAFAGTLSLEPTNPLAMQTSRYPITEIGLANLSQRLTEVAEAAMSDGRSQVKLFDDVRINGRPCRLVECRREVEHPQVPFAMARLYFDRELELPLRFEAYGYPDKPGDDPPLVEEFTYVDLKLDNGFTDIDFDIANPDYDFRPLSAREPETTR